MGKRKILDSPNSGKKGLGLKTRPKRSLPTKRNLDFSLRKSKVVEEKRTLDDTLHSTSIETTPKKRSLGSHTNNTPLKENPANMPPSMISPKNFYGLKSKTVVEEIKSLEKGVGNSPLKGRFDCMESFSPDNKVNQKILEKISLSPVKQAVIKSCSMEQFKRLYRDEILAMEREVEIQARPRTRQISKIVTIQDEDDFHDISDQSDSYHDAESDSDDNEVTFKVSRGLDKDDDHDDSKSMGSQIVERFTIESDESSENSRESLTENTEFVENSQNTTLEDHTLQMTSGSIQNTSSQSSLSEKRFFKYRSLKENVKSRNIIIGKKFELKFSPVSGNQKKFSKVNSSKKHQSKRSVTQMKNNHHTSPSGFSFAPGFLSPKQPCDRLIKSNKCILAKKEKDKEIESDFGFADLDENETFVMEEDLMLNKQGQKTYMSPNVEKFNNSSSLNSRFDQTDNSLECEMDSEINSPDVHKHTGSDDLFSTQDSNEEKSQLKNNSNVIESLERNHVDNNRTSKDSPSKRSASPKLFSIFTNQKRNRPSPRFSTESPKKALSPLSHSVTPLKVTKTIGREDQTQMIIDAGQKKFGATQCPVCGMVYCHADPLDEAAHHKFHKRLQDTLKFSGWKKETVVQEFPMEMSRVVLVMNDAPKYARKKVEDITQVMGRDLGFPDNAPAYLHPHHRVFLYINSERERIEGCCVAEPISEGFRVLPQPLDSNDSSGQRPWCCAKTSSPACVGISRIWVAADVRRSGVASKLMDCVLQGFEYGSYIPKHKIALSDPTPDGRRFAEKYFGTKAFLVYRFNTSRQT